TIPKNQGIAVFMLAFSPSGEQLACFDLDGTTRIIDRATGKELRKFKGGDMDGFFGDQTALVYSPDGKMIATSGLELINNQDTFRLRLWDAATGQQLRTVNIGDDGDGALSPAFSPDSKLLAFGRFDGRITLVEVATGTEVHKLQLERPVPM